VQVVPSNWGATKALLLVPYLFRKPSHFDMAQAMHPAGKCRIIMRIVLIIRLTSKETPVPLAPDCYGINLVLMLHQR
jgi:hypothetical protein